MAGVMHTVVMTLLAADDPEQQKLFFVTYRQHASPVDLLRAVNETFLQPRVDVASAQKRVGSFLLRWLESCPEGNRSPSFPCRAR